MQEISKTGNTSLISGFIFRFSAFIIDSLLIASLWGVIITIFKIPAYNLTFILYLLYCFIVTAIFSTTLGKYIFNMYVIKSDNKRPGILSVFLREIPGKFLSSIPFSLGFFWSVFDKRKQTWHDKIAGTLVVFRKTPGNMRVVLAYAVFIIFILMFVYQFVYFYTNYVR